MSWSRHTGRTSAVSPPPESRSRAGVGGYPLGLSHRARRGRNGVPDDALVLGYHPNRPLPHLGGVLLCLSHDPISQKLEPPANSVRLNCRSSLTRARSAQVRSTPQLGQISLHFRHSVGPPQKGQTSSSEYSMVHLRSRGASLSRGAWLYRCAFPWSDRSSAVFVPPFIENIDDLGEGLGGGRADDHIEGGLVERVARVEVVEYAETREVPGDVAYGDHGAVRPDDDQCIVGAVLGEEVPHVAVARGRLAEEDHIGAERSVAPGAGTALRGVAVVADVGAAAAASAAEVDDRAMEVEYAVFGEAGALEEVVDVLGHDDGVGVPRGVGGDADVRGVGGAVGEVPAAGVVPGVDFGSGRLTFVVLAGEPSFDGEFLVDPAGAAKGRDPAVGGEAGAGEEDRPQGSSRRCRRGFLPVLRSGRKGRWRARDAQLVGRGESVAWRSH